MEQTRLDDDTHDGGEYNIYINRLQKKMSSILCDLDIFIEEAGGHIDDHVTRDAMTLELRSISQNPKRYERDYMVIRKTGELLSALKIQYQAWKESLDLTN